MDELIRSWQLAVSPSGDGERLRQRWRMLGWTGEEVRERMGRGGLFPVREADAEDVATLHRLDIGCSMPEIPFGEIFGRIAAAALQDLPDVVGRVLGPAARESACCDLGKSLALESASALVASLRGRGGLAAAFVATDSRDLYEHFVSELLAGGWAEFLSRHPVLARQLALRIGHWRASLEEFARHCEDDLAARAEAFGITSGQVEALEFDLGDTHRRGRKVLGVTFAGNIQLLYKPRSLQMDVAWCALLRWLREQRPALKLSAPLALDGGTHGWVERVVPGSPERPADYYHRAGELLAIAWACGGSDFHEENVIATEAGPVLVDLETLFTPLVRPFGATDEELRSVDDEENFSDSALATLLLPVWKVEEDGRARDLSGLGGMERARAGWSELEWVDLGTDAMREAFLPASDRQPDNVPRNQAGGLIPATAYVDEIVRGYIEAARAVLDLKDQLPLEGFRGAEIRFLARSSDVYGRLLIRLRRPELLQNEAARAIEIEKLARAFLPPDPMLPVPK